MRIFDLFWLYEETVVIDTLLLLVKLQKQIILSLDTDEMFIFIKDNLLKNSIEQFGIEKCIPKYTIKSGLVEKEVLI